MDLVEGWLIRGKNVDLAPEKDNDPDELVFLMGDEPPVKLRVVIFAAIETFYLECCYHTVFFICQYERFFRRGNVDYCIRTGLFDHLARLFDAGRKKEHAFRNLFYDFIEELDRANIIDENKIRAGVMLSRHFGSLKIISTGRGLAQIEQFGKITMPMRRDRTRQAMIAFYGAYSKACGGTLLFSRDLCFKMMRMIWRHRYGMVWDGAGEYVPKK